MKERSEVMGGHLQKHYLCAMVYYGELVKHFFTSHSRHGTHSPFVYRLAEQIVYKASGEEGSNVVVFPVGFSARYTLLLGDILAFWGISELEQFPPSHTESAVWAELEKSDVEDVVNLVRNGRVIVVDEPFKNRKRRTLWKALVNHPQITVSINFFHFGILLYRKEQRKENFVLRYPYWRA